jgi:hypothetical protein
MVQVQIRDKWLAAKVVKYPFVRMGERLVEIPLPNILDEEFSMRVPPGRSTPTRTNGCGRKAMVLSPWALPGARIASEIWSM